MPITLMTANKKKIRRRFNKELIKRRNNLKIEKVGKLSPAKSTATTISDLLISLK
jgi:hypothetical protein